MRTRCIIRVVYVVTVVSTCSSALACGVHGTNAGNDINGWFPTGTGGGIVQGLLSLPSTLVPPTEPTTCTAAVGLGSIDNPLPLEVIVTSAAYTIVNSADGSRRPFPEFSFSPNTNATAAFAAGSGDTSDPTTNPLFAGSRWFGFASAVEPFSLPSLEPNEFLALEFNVEVPEALLPLETHAQYAAGQGMTDGTPIFTGDHPAQYYSATDTRIVLTVPEPTGWALALCALTGLGLCDRRRWWKSNRNDR